MTSPTSMARSPSIVLIEQNREAMASNWTDAIVVSRNHQRHFNVYARRHTETMGIAARRRWLTLDSTVGLKDPSTLLAAIKSAAEELELELAWDDAIAVLAELDWVIAAVVAKNVDCELPAPPTFKQLSQQRGSCARASIEVSVEWGYDPHSIFVPMRDWVEILGGGYYSDEEPYSYEGERLTAVWRINGTGADSLKITYDDGGIGFIGALAEASIRGPQIFGHDVATLLIEAASNTACGTVDLRRDEYA